MSLEEAHQAADRLNLLGQNLLAHWRSVGWSSTHSIASMHSAGPLLSMDEIAVEISIAANKIKNDPRAEQIGLSDFCRTVQNRAEEVAIAPVGANPALYILGVMDLVNYVYRYLPSVPVQEAPKINWIDLKEEKSLIPRDLAARLRSIDATLNAIEPKSTSMSEKMAYIEAVHAAAEQTPSDLQELAIWKTEIEKLKDHTYKLYEDIQSSNTRSLDSQRAIERIKEEIEKKSTESSAVIDDIIKRSNSALRGATSVGLAKAFEVRKVSLSRTGFAWTVGLIIALFCGAYVGWERVNSLKEVLTGSKSASVIWSNVLLTLLGVGAPVWFAWLATKQIGTTFRLAEDYAFKASVSQAYEGYRVEAVEIDPVLRERLFVSALSRIEEAPIRLLDGENYSSPLIELLSRPGIKSSLEAVPGIVDKIVALIPSKAGPATAVIGSAAAVAAVVSQDNKNSDE